MKNLLSNFDDTEVVNCCVKPLSQQVKVDYALDTASTYYDSFKGEQLALAADGNKALHNKNSKERPTYKNGTMDKQSFMSTTPMENVSKYIVGVFQDREFHATSVKSIVQMRPSYSYFDKLDKRNKAEQKAENEADLDEEEVKQVTVKFARIENDKVKKAREKSFNFLSQKGTDEAWCETLWHGKSSTTAELEKQKLFTTNSSLTGHALCLTNKEYIELLVPPDELEITPTVELTKDSNVISREMLKTLPLIDQLKIVLRDSKVVNLTNLMTLLDDKLLTTEKVLRALPSAGLLIRGNWVVQSEFLYPTDGVSSINGVPSELMCRGRDYILYKLTKGDCIDRKRIANVVQLPPEEVKEILLTVGRLNQNKQWELQQAPDLTFENKYQEIVQRQEMYWRAKEDKFNEMELERSPKRVRKKSVREGKTSTTTTSGGGAGTSTSGDSNKTMINGL